VSRLVKTSIVVMTIFMLAVIPACSTDDPVGGLQPVCITFVPDADPTLGEVAPVWSDTSDCAVAEVELVVTGVTDVWSTSFEVDYPSGIAFVVQAVDLSDSFLGADALFTILEDPLGHVEIGVTRVDTGTNIGVTPTPGNDVLVRMAFVRFASGGSGDVIFGNANLSQRSTAIPGTPIPVDPPVPFIDGMLTIN